MATSNFLTVSDITSEQIERIFAKIDIDPVDPLGKCWIWNGSKIKNGYGNLKYNGRVELIHRITYAWLIEPLRRGRRGNVPVLDHIVCDNPSCCNPFHLRLVSDIENVWRSNSAACINRRKTHCIRGHELPPKVTGKQRTCPICAKVSNTRHRRKIGIRSRQEYLADKHLKSSV